MLFLYDNIEAIRYRFYTWTMMLFVEYHGPGSLLVKALQEDERNTLVCAQRGFLFAHTKSSMCPHCAWATWHDTDSYESCLLCAVSPGIKLGSTRQRCAQSAPVLLLIHLFIPRIIARRSNSSYESVSVASPKVSQIRLGSGSLLVIEPSVIK